MRSFYLGAGPSKVCWNGNNQTRSNVIPGEPLQSVMNPCEPILFQQLPVIQKIIQDETWLESERRGCRVGSDDRVVRERVCQVVLRVGQQLRESLSPSFAHTS